MEIKFRAKDFKDNWVYSNSRKEENGEVFYLVNGEWVKVKKETEGVWTCFKDRKGREIYEHDIVDAVVSYDEILRLKVYWDYERGCWNLMDRHGFNYYDFYDGKTPFEYIEEFEVVGNIIDNPELMTKKDKEE